ncbi:hypothetical protein C8R44DRAFT_724374 [Mycena epipterygia]|nr:hypothetical protein C8R44DRAFT_724374 [Mycena epipterygia]
MASTNLSFDDIMDLPLDPSPLPLSRHSSPTARATITEPPPPPSLNPCPLQRKRPAENMPQYAGEVSCAHKLVKPDHDKLVEFAQSGRAEQMVLLAGQLLALGHHQRQLQPADIPVSVQEASDPSIPAYRDDKIGPTKLLTDMVLANPDWGFTAKMKAERDAKDALNTSISKALISKRNIIKTAICGSLGSDPVDGSTLRPGALNIAQLSSHILSKLKVTTKVDLRLMITHWGAVDKKLVGIRDKHPEAKNQSRFIKQRMLDPDMAVCGVIDLNALARTPSVPAADPSTVASGSGGGRAADDDNEMFLGTFGDARANIYKYHGQNIYTTFLPNGGVPPEDEPQSSPIKTRIRVSWTLEP